MWDFLSFSCDILVLLTATDLWLRSLCRIQLVLEQVPEVYQRY